MKSLTGGILEPEERRGQSNGVNVIDGWREHPLLAAAVTLGCLLVGLPMAWFLGKPQYFAEATVYVSPTFIKNLEEDSEQKRQYDTFVQQQVNTITRFDILSETLAQSKALGFVWIRPGESEKEAVERLSQELQIRRIPETYQIAIGLRAAKPAGLAEFVNSLADNFLQKARAEEFYGQKERLDNLEKERVGLDRDLATKSTRLASLAGELGVANFSPQLVNPYDQVLTKNKEELNGARQKRLEAEALVEVLESKDGPQSGGVGIITQALAADPELTRMRNVLNARRLELSAAMRGLAPEHPARQKAEREIEENEADLKRVTDRTQERIRVQTLASSREDLRRAQHVEAGLERAIALQESRASRFSRTLQQGVDLTNEIERLRARRNTIDDRIRYLTVEASAPGFLRLFAPAQRPDEPTKGKRILLAALVLGMTGLLGMVIPMSVEALNTKVRNAAIVDRIVGFQPVGIVLDEREIAREFGEEHLARLVAGLERANQTMLARAFLLTPLRASSGNAELAMLLGGELQRRGHRTLVIDACAMDRDGHPGLQEALDNPAFLPGAILTGEHGAPDRIRAGGDSGGPHFGNLHNFGALLETLHRRYDLILLDAAPLFLSSDTEYLVRCADVTMLNIDAGHVRESELERAISLLKRLQPGGLGVILNRVRPSAAGSVFRQDLKHFRAYHRPASRSLLPPPDKPDVPALPPPNQSKDKEVVPVSFR